LQRRAKIADCGPSPSPAGQLEEISLVNDTTSARVAVDVGHDGTSFEVVCPVFWPET